MMTNHSHSSDSASNQSNSPILSFLGSPKKRKVQYLRFQVQTIKIHKSHASYQVQVNDQGKIWIMEIRYSALRQFYQKLISLFQIKISFPHKFILGNLTPEKLKKRAHGIQQFLDVVGSNYQLSNSDELKQFLIKHTQDGTQIIDYTEVEELDLNL